MNGAWLQVARPKENNEKAWDSEWIYWPVTFVNKGFNFKRGERGNYTGFQSQGVENKKIFLKNWIFKNSQSVAATAFFPWKTLGRSLWGCKKSEIQNNSERILNTLTYKTNSSVLIPKVNKGMEVAWHCRSTSLPLQDLLYLIHFF